MTSTPPPTAPARLLGLRRALATGFAIQLVFSLLAMSPAVLAPVVALDLGIDPKWIGLVFAVKSASGLLLGTASGTVFRRFGMIRSLQIGSMALATSMLLYASGSVPLILLGALMAGFALGWAAPACTFMLSRAAPPERINTLMSIQQVGPPLGIGIGGAIIPTLILVLGWRGALLVLASAGVVATAYLQTLRARIDRDVQPGTVLGVAAILQPLRFALGDRRLRLLCFAGALFAFVHTGQVNFLVTYLNVELHISLVIAGLTLFGSQAMSMIGRVFWGWYADRRRDALLAMVLIAFGSLVLSAALGLYPRGGPLWPLVTIAVLFGATAAGWQGVLFAAIARHAPDGRVVTAMSGVQFFFVAGAVGGPILFSVVVAIAGSYAFAYVLLAAAAGVLGASLISIRASRRGETA